MSNAIGLLKSPVGNLQSAYNALYENGIDPIWVDRDFTEYDDLTHLIIPGVGHFRAIMTYFEESGFSGAVKEFATSGRPVMGICVGMQIMATLGTEGQVTAGLGLIEAQVTRLDENRQTPLPHVGWNTVEIIRAHPVLADIKPDRDFYFVHSYAMETLDPANTIGMSEYGRRFASIVARDNIIACQFHPEKSQANGIKILENFCEWDGKC